MQKTSLGLVCCLCAGAITGCVGGHATFSRRSEPTAANPTDADPVASRDPLSISAPRAQGGRAATKSGATAPVPESLPRSAGSDVHLASMLAGSPDSLPIPSATDRLLDWEAPDLIRLPPVADSDASFLDDLAEQGSRILTDHKEFYSASGLLALGAGVATGALMANTPFDESVLHDAYAENVVLAPTHEFYERLHQPKILGDGRYTIPVFAVAAMTEPLLGDRSYLGTTAEWGQRSLRTMLVGGPPMLGLQYLTGGSRPGESPSQSKWDPGADNNGVSGHSFMGAIPFVSAAKMTDRRWIKAGWYVASALPALSRINDDDHYPSQAFLGWWVAYLAASAVDRSQASTPNHRVQILPQADGIGVAIEY